MLSENESNTKYDVLIIGGGLAGLTLAKQLLIADPGLVICIVHNRKFPNPERIHKVGESTVEIGAFYLSNVVGCASHLQTDHLRKMGLRFIQTLGQSGEAAPYRELGLTNYDAHHVTYQIDRGKLENHLYGELFRSITLIENSKVLDFERQGDRNEVSIRDHAGKINTRSARWVVDASGRGRVLMKKFDLKKDSGIAHSSVWFRVAGKVDINEFLASSDPANPFLNVKERGRSTTHLVGKGYWVWIIPINEQTTSVGIVFDNSIHDLSTMSAYPMAMTWLKRHEPRFHRYMEGKGFEVLDFAMMRNYSYLSKQFLSHDGWALTGEAAGFVDPLYSNGTDMIGLANTMITNAITQSDSEDQITWMNSVLSGVYAGFADTHRDSFGRFDDWNYIFVKTNWDATFYFLFVCVLFMNRKFEDIRFVHAIYDRFIAFYNIHHEVISYLRQSDTLSSDYVIPDFVNLLGSIQDYANRTIIVKDPSDDAIMALLDHNLGILKELAASILETKTFDQNFYHMKERLDAASPSF